MLVPHHSGDAVPAPDASDVVWTVVAFGGPALLLLLVVILVVRGTRRETSPSRAAAAARRHAAVVHVLAWVVAVVALPLLGYGTVPGVHDAMRAYARAIGGSGFLAGGVLVGLTPAGVGLAFLLVHAVGELTWPRPTGSVRRATLRPRAVADVAPARSRRLTWVWAGLLAATLVVGALTAEPDGRSVGRTFLGGAATHTPYPGWFYGLPLLVAAALVLAGQEVVLRLVTRRPAVSDTADAWDLGLRRLSAHRVLRGTQLVLGATAGAVLVVAGLAARGLGDASANGAAPPGSTAYLLGGVLVTLAGVAVLVVSVALTLQPGDAAVAPAPTPGAAAAAPAR